MDTYYVKAAAYARVDDYARARATLLEAARREPHDFVTWGLIGDLAVRRGELGQARRAYGRAAELNPQNQGLAQLAKNPTPEQLIETVKLSSSTLDPMPRRSKIRRAACILAGVGILASGGQAAAQSDGVVVDPDSPAGKEYALPLDKARQDVAPAGEAGSSGSEDTPLFGAGISKRKSGEGGQAGDGNDGRGQGDGGENKGSGGQAAGGSAVTAAAGASGSGLSSGWLTALVAIGVLLVGGIVGLSLRALRSTESD